MGGYGHDRATDSIVTTLSDETIQLATKCFLQNVKWLDTQPKEKVMFE